jgi:hypothetical protein
VPSVLPVIRRTTSPTRKPKVCAWYRRSVPGCQSGFCASSARMTGCHAQASSNVGDTSTAGRPAWWESSQRAGSAPCRQLRTPASARPRGRPDRARRAAPGDGRRSRWRPWSWRRPVRSCLRSRHGSPHDRPSRPTDRPPGDRPGRRNTRRPPRALVGRVPATDHTKISSDSFWCQTISTTTSRTNGPMGGASGASPSASCSSAAWSRSPCGPHSTADSARQGA